MKINWKKEQKYFTRLRRYALLPDYYKKRVSDNTFFSEDDFIYLKQLYGSKQSI